MNGNAQWVQICRLCFACVFALSVEMLKQADASKRFAEYWR